MTLTGKRLRRRVIGALAALVFAAPLGAHHTEEHGITVFAAASLSDVLKEIGSEFQRETGIASRFSFAASSALARQIESGAPAQVFVSADADWMDYLAGKGLIDVATRRNIAGNDLVLIAPADSNVKLEVGSGIPIAAALGEGRLALADPDSVPAGRYARAALTALGVWKSVEGRLVPAENVRVALAFVSRGEAPLGIVYRTDARVDPKVRIVGAFPASSHPPIVYPAAAVGRAGDNAMRFIDYLGGAKAQALLRRHGFKEPPR
jgi:molybdate transport system substrate-binding protein